MESYNNKKKSQFSRVLNFFEANYDFFVIIIEMSKYIKKRVIPNGLLMDFDEVRKLL